MMFTKAVFFMLISLFIASCSNRQMPPEPQLVPAYDVPPQESQPQPSTDKNEMGEKASDAKVLFDDTGRKEIPLCVHHARAAR